MFMRKEKKSREKNTVIFADAWGNRYHPFFSKKVDGIAKGMKKAGLKLQVVYVCAPYEQEPLMVVLEDPDVAGLIYPYNNYVYLAQLREKFPDLPIVADVEMIPFENSVTVQLDDAWMGVKAADWLCRQTDVRKVALIYHKDSVLTGFSDVLLKQHGSVKLAAALTCWHGDEIPSIVHQLSHTEFDGAFFSDDVYGKVILNELQKVVSFKDKKIIAYHNKGGDLPPLYDACLEADGLEFGLLVASTTVQFLDGILGDNVRILYQPRLVIPKKKG